MMKRGQLNSIIANRASPRQHTTAIQVTLDFMTPEKLIRRCHDLAGLGDEMAVDADSLIGFFQTFRPAGQAIADLFSDMDQGDALHRRLDQLYAVAGDDRRPTGGRDAYFVVRKPQSIDPAEVKQAAQSWLAGVRQIALTVDDAEVAEMLAPPPAIRVLEGIPPKHPKADIEKSHLLRTIQTKAPAMVERIDGGPMAAVLSPAFYFTACDAMLRDYLMWPFYAQATGLTDPLASYFTLWKHGVKYRIFGESQVDFYVPRQAT